MSDLPDPTEREREENDGFKSMDYGDTIGFIVVMWEHGEWTEDWDGKVHPTIEAGRQALRDCSQNGYVCFLGRITYEPGSAVTGNLATIDATESDLAQAREELNRLKEGLIRLVHSDYDAGWNPEEYADALLDNSELDDQEWTIEDSRRL